ncbi:MAG: rnhA operon protein [Halalkalicoccus sp.]|nr:rnhA operon protein [Halalkalicoccus sp.]
MAELPDDVVEEATRLTKLARAAVDSDEATAYRDHRTELLADHGFSARVREDDATETLVFHPAEWVDDGAIRPDRVENVDRAVEIQVAGPQSPDDWDAVERHNRAIAARVREEYGDVHGDNADAFADFMGNHYAKPIEAATPEERAEFVEEYFVRNAWPSEAQTEVVEQSLEYVEKTAKTDRS